MDDATFDKGMSVIIRESERLSGIVEELLDFFPHAERPYDLDNGQNRHPCRVGRSGLYVQQRAKSEHKYLLYEEPRMLSPVLGTSTGCVRYLSISWTMR